MGKGKKNKPGSRQKGAKGQRGKGPKGFSPSAPLPPGPSAPHLGSRDTDQLNALVVICGRELLNGGRGKGAKGQRGNGPKGGDARGSNPSAPSVPSFEDGLVETVDPADRAHSVRVGGKSGGMLMPAHVIVRGVAVANRMLPARPRRYPASQVNGAGLAVDSQFDDLHEREIRLEGLAAFGRKDPEGVRPWERQASAFVEHRYAAIARLGAKGFELLHKRKTRQAGADPVAEAMASAMLAEAE